MTTSQTPQNPSASSEKPVIGVLLIHGFNGTRLDLTDLEEALQDRGMITHNMLLPGHGTHVRDLAPLGWSDWSQAVRSEVQKLNESCDVVFLVGHSLGGSLALHAATHEEVAGVVTMCAPIRMHPLTKVFVNIAKYVTPLLPTIPGNLRDSEMRRQYKRDIYRWTPMRPIGSMLEYLPQLRAELPRMTVPALIMISIYDPVVPARDGHEIYRLIGSYDKHLVAFHRSYHLIMKDRDRGEVIDKTIAFILRHASKAKPHQKVSSAEQTA
jgi:carboxylesterase